MRHITGYYNMARLRRNPPRGGTLLPGGDVLQVSLLKSSGVQAYDEAVGRAIQAAQPLPVPSESDLFQAYFRKINLKFRPRE